MKVVFLDCDVSLVTSFIFLYYRKQKEKAKVIQEYCYEKKSETPKSSNILICIPFTFHFVCGMGWGRVRGWRSGI